MPIRATTPFPPRWIPGRALRGAAALLAAVAALGLAACGGEDEPAPEQAAETTDTGGEVTAEPPPETAPPGGEAESGSTTAEERAESEVVEDTQSGPTPCPDVAVAQNSDSGLFAVEAEGITCEDATAALQAWGASGYPGDEPPGFACEDVSTEETASTRLRCRQEASGGVVEFDTGL